MKERIIVIPNSNKLSLSLTYKNKPSFNERYFTPVELARELLLRNGMTCNLEFINSNDELSYYMDIVSKVNYFKTTKLADLKAINNTINTIRKLIIDAEENTIEAILNKGAFKEKNEALLNVYYLYISRLKEENKVDMIGLIRYAINNIETSDIEINTLEEYKLQPLEYKLIKKASTNIKELSIFDMYDVKKNNIHINSYMNCYGSSSEVGNILSDIFSRHKMDECVVACCDYPTYSQIFYDYACKYDINLTFANGLAIINSYPGKLLKQYYYWTNEDNFGFKSLFELIYSPYFRFDLLDSLVDVEDKGLFYERLSKLRLTNKLDINTQRINEFKKAIARDINDNNRLLSYVNALELISNELALPTEEFIYKYSVIRNNNVFVTNFDEASKNVIINEIKTIKNIDLDISSDIIETLLRKTAYRENNKPGHIHITNIDNALSSLRDGLYICGLSSTIYPGLPKENPLLLDSDLSDFDNFDLTSSGKIKAKRDTLINLVSLASSLNNEINLTYPGLNVSELKNNNASSLMYEIYKLENGDDKSLDDFKNQTIKVGYFEPKLSNSRLIGQTYNEVKEIIYKKKESNNTESINLDIGKYSPSALNTFFNCKKQFFYQNLLKLNVEDDYNPYEVISATEQGTLIHALMEYLSTNRMNKNDFLVLADQVFDEYMHISVPLIKEKINDVKEQFIEMVANGWQMDNDNPREIALTEVDKDAIHLETGIKIHGFPDRVEKTKDGKAVIVDFKTERDRDAHKKDDIDSCLQVIVYAYIIENTLGLKVDHAEYRMLRFEDGIVTCKYDQEIKDALTQKLIEFKDTLISGDFSIPQMTKDEEKNKCKYCKYGKICGKVVVDNE